METIINSSKGVSINFLRGKSNASGYSIQAALLLKTRSMLRKITTGLGAVVDTIET